MTERRGSLAIAGTLLGISAAIAVEWWLFETSVRDYLLGTYPKHHDQVVYLNLAYANYHRILDQGIWRAIVASLQDLRANGALLDFEGALSFLVVEPNRVGALSVTFAHFAALQVVTLFVASWRTGTLAFGIIANALLIASNFLFIVPGGIFDFRIDASASCAFGIYIALLLRSRFYRSLPWSVAAGAVAGYLIALRHNMAVHVGLMQVAFLFVILIADKADSAPRFDRDPRLRNLVISAATLALLAAPFLVLAFDQISSYYLTQFAVRAPARNALSGRTFVEHWLFYPYAIYFHQIRYPLVLCAGVAATLWAMRSRASGVEPRAQRRRYCYTALLERYVPVVAGIAIPLTVLTLHSDRSPVAIGLTVTPIVLLLTFLLDDATSLGSKGWQDTPALLAVAALTTVGALGLHGLQHQTWRSDQEQVANVDRAAFEMHYELGRFMQEIGKPRPQYVINTVQDFLEPGIGATPVFERERRRFQPMVLTRAQQIFPVEEQEFWRRFESSDAVLLQTGGPSLDFPYTVFVRSVEDRIRDELRRHFLPFGRWTIGDYAVAGWIAPSMTLVEGVNHCVGKASADGLSSFTVTIPHRLASARPRMVLRGARSRGGVPLEMEATANGLTIDSTLTARPEGLRMEVRFPAEALAKNDPVELTIELRDGRLKGGGGAPAPLTRMPTDAKFLDDGDAGR